MCIRVYSSIVICSYCEKPDYRGQIFFARNKSIRKLPFLAHKHAWCSLHRTNQHDNSPYIVQRRGSKHGTSRHHRFGQQNGQRNFDPTSTTLVDACSPAASSSSSSLAHIISFFIAASSRSTIIIDSSTHLSFHLSSIAFYGYWSTSSAIFSSPASSCSASTTTITAGASSPPDGIGYSFIATSSNDINTKPIYFPLLTISPSAINFLKAPVLEGYRTEAARRGQHGHDHANCSTCINIEQTTSTAEATKFISDYGTT